MASQILAHLADLSFGCFFGGRLCPKEVLPSYCELLVLQHLLSLIFAVSFLKNVFEFLMIIVI